jgi:hypothetical protein
LNQIREWGVEVIASPNRPGGAWHNVLMSNTILSMKNTCDFVIPLDTDEFIVCSEDVLANRSFCRQRLLEQFHAIPQDASMIKFPQMFLSLVNPNEKGYNKGAYACPAKEMHFFSANHNPVNPELGWGGKTFFRASEFEWVDEGNHHGRTKSGCEYKSGLGLFHYHYTGGKRLFERALQLVDAYVLIDRNLPLEEQIAICEKPYGGLTFHRRDEYYQFILREWIIDQWQDYAHALPSLERVNQMTKLGSRQNIQNYLQEFFSKNSIEEALAAFSNENFALAREDLIFYDPPLETDQPQFCYVFQSSYVSDALRSDALRQEALISHG